MTSPGLCPYLSWGRMNLPRILEQPQPACRSILANLTRHTFPMGLSIHPDPITAYEGFWQSENLWCWGFRSNMEQGGV